MYLFLQKLLTTLRLTEKNFQILMDMITAIWKEISATGLAGRVIRQL